MTEALILAGVLAAFLAVVVWDQFRRRRPPKPRTRWATWKDEPKTLSDYVRFGGPGASTDGPAGGGGGDGGD